MGVTLHIELARSNSRRKQKPGKHLLSFFLLINCNVTKSYSNAKLIMWKFTRHFLMLSAGSGPYVVIDRRTKSGNDAKETSSDDGNMFCSLFLYKL